MMRKTLAAVAALALVGVAVGSPNFGSAQTAPPWPTFHAGITRSGYTTAAGPTGPAASNRWVTTLNTAVTSSPVVDTNGIGYVGADDKNVYAFDPSNPSKAKWTFATGGPVRSTGTLSADGKLLFIGSNDGNVYALDTSTGKQVWKATMGAPVAASPLLAPDGQTLYINDVNGNVNAIKASDGSNVWTKPYSLGSAVSGSMAMSPDGSTIYVAAGSLLIAIPTSGGTGQTPFYLDGPATSSPAVDGNGNVYLETIRGTLFSFAPGSSTPRWSRKDPQLIATGATPAISPTGLVIAGSGEGVVIDVTTSSGDPSWSAFPNTGAAINSSPAISGNGIVYIGNSNGILYALDLKSGAQLWSKQLATSITASPAIGPDGSLWIADGSGYVYRLKALTPPGTPPPGPTRTAGPTSTAGPTTVPPTSGPLPTATTPSATVAVTLKASVKPGQKQTIKVTTGAGLTVRFRIQYPNGDHQSHKGTAGANGTVTYSYKQGQSKIMHNKFAASVIVTVGDGAAKTSKTVTYKIGFGKIDVSVEPRSQAANKLVDIYVHTGVGKRVQAVLLLPNRKFVALRGKTGPHGFAHIRWKVPTKTASGSKRTVKIVAGLQPGKSGYSTQTTLKIK